ncbi:MAG: hypothetical protein HY507_01875 [Candidatus Zambryskibacteria bacterium]|nr:hypothetical protein [Candidatus Zambryskibacteria bacterium]
MERRHLETILTINRGFWRYMPFELHAKEADQLALDDSEMTQMFLRESFVYLAVLVVVLNIAFYAGRGDIERWSKCPIVAISKKWRSIKFKARQKRNGITLRNPGHNKIISGLELH